MSQFHITRGGHAALCEANVRACPLGEHYGSRKDAATAALAGDLNAAPHSSSNGLPAGQPDTGHAVDPQVHSQEPQPLVEFGKHAGQPLSALLADVGYCRWLMEQDWFRQEYPDMLRQLQEHRGVEQLRRDFRRL